MTQIAPSLHGLYRAIITTPYPWALAQVQQLSTQANALLAPDMLGRLNRLPADLASDQTLSPECLKYISTFAERYDSKARRLSGYFLMCCIMEVQWTTLAQALMPSSIKIAPSSTKAIEGAAADNAWTALSDKKCEVNVTATEARLREIIKATIDKSMKSFTELTLQFDEDQTTIETYALETMAESLVSLDDSPSGALILI